MIPAVIFLSQVKKNYHHNDYHVCLIVVVSMAKISVHCVGCTISTIHKMFHCLCSHT